MAWWRHMAHKSGSTLAQVMACCLTAPSHYLNLWSKGFCGILLRAISQQMLKISVCKTSLKLQFWNYLHISRGANELSHEVSWQGSSFLLAIKGVLKTCVMTSILSSLGGYDWVPLQWFNPLRAKFFRGNINIYLHFVSFLHIDTMQVV